VASDDVWAYLVTLFTGAAELALLVFAVYGLTVVGATEFAASGTALLVALLVVASLALVALLVRSLTARRAKGLELFVPGWTWAAALFGVAAGVLAIAAGAVLQPCSQDVGKGLVLLLIMIGVLAFLLAVVGAILLCTAVRITVRFGPAAEPSPPLKQAGSSARVSFAVGM
jgi:hypothetical protein